MCSQIRRIIIIASTLIIIIYTLRLEEIIIAVESKLGGWCAVLMQNVNGKRYSTRYKSGIWSPQEQKYDITKKECRGVFMILKKFRSWIYEIYFIIKID